MQSQGFSLPAPYQPVMRVHASDPSTQEGEAEVSIGQDYPQIQSKFNANLGFKKKKFKRKEEKKDKARYGDSCNSSPLEGETGSP